jgi:hypothetical protein
MKNSIRLATLTAALALAPAPAVVLRFRLLPRRLRR